MAAALPVPACAAELPRAAQDVLAQSTPDAADAGSWRLDALFDWLWGLVRDDFDAPLRFSAQAVFYLSAASVLGLLAGKGGWRRCADTAAAIGFAALGLGAVRPLAVLLADTAQDSQNYLAAFVPVYSGAALLGGQTAGAAAYSGLFYATACFLSGALRDVFLPVLEVYFCLAACAAVWGNPGMEEAAALFARCLNWLLKGCGALFGTVLGLQSVLAGTADSAALRAGRGILQGCIPVVGDAAAAALNGAAAAVQTLKGSLALAALAALAACFAPALAQCVLYYLAFCAAGIAAGAGGQGQSARLCRMYAKGVGLCASVTVLYFFLLFLSTALLLITGNGGSV